MVASSTSAAKAAGTQVSTIIRAKHSVKTFLNFFIKSIILSKMKIVELVSSDSCGKEKSQGHPWLG
jgi:hypothetical protein